MTGSIERKFYLWFQRSLKILKKPLHFPKQCERITIAILPCKYPIAMGILLKQIMFQNGLFKQIIVKNVVDIYYLLKYMKRDD